ncbi:hypothetical protein BGW41_007129 [Actinomortierella wolfii]|nr:hypothetical protein BGW41_007129 [Actinomortierella wolfii]
MPISAISHNSVTYNVVGFPSAHAGSYGVLINGSITKLSTSPKDFPLWSATIAGTSTPSVYQYVELSEQGTIVQQEPFLRIFQSGDITSTANEFFMRQVTRTTLPEIPQVFEDVRPNPSKFFDHSQIATIHLTPDPDEFAAMVADADRSANREVKVKAGFRFISADTSYSSKKKVKVKVSGRDTLNFEKLSLRIKFDDEDASFGQPVLKLRSSVFDPTMTCEKLYIDVLNAIGVKTVQGAWVRVYVNRKPYGFFLMVEDIELPFLQRTIYQGNSTPIALSSLFKMSNTRPPLPPDEATLQFAGSDLKNYKEEVYKHEDLGGKQRNEALAQLISFLKDLQDYDPALPGGIEFWNSRLDLDGFLRCMAMEFLGGVWDGYWYSGNNFFMYFDAADNRWLFIPTDFDRSFNDGNLPDVLTTYTKFAQSRLAEQGKDHPLVTKLVFKSREINTRFKQILLDIVKRVFNLEALEPRIDAYEKMIADEVNWDYSLDRSKNPTKTPCRNFQFTIEDFHLGFISRVVKVNPKIENRTDINPGIKPWIKSRVESVPASLL